MAITRGNLFVAPEPPVSGERVETVAELSDVRVEHILSSSHPDPAPYDQAQDEWVVLLAGEATLEVAGERVELHAGDHVLLPAHTLHRVLHTSHGARWLAV